jgi:DNA polymerase III gamma/tau subunit
VEREVLEDHYKRILNEYCKENDRGFDSTAITNLARIASLGANGSVRDGLSLLQTRLIGDGNDEDYASKYFELVGSIYSQDVATALALVSELRKAEEGRVIIQTLEKWFYWCSMETFGMKTPVRDFFGDTKLDFDLTHLQRLFDSCLAIERNFTATPNAKIVLEMGIMKLCL